MIKLSEHLSGILVCSPLAVYHLSPLHPTTPSLAVLPYADRGTSDGWKSWTMKAARNPDGTCGKAIEMQLKHLSSRALLKVLARSLARHDSVRISMESVRETPAY